MQERAEGDYISSRVVSGGSRFVPWVISKKERAQLPIGTLRKLRKLECEVGQPAESGLCVAPQLGSPASLDGPAGCSVAPRTLKRRRRAAAEVATRGCGHAAVVPPPAPAKA